MMMQAHTTDGLLNQALTAAAPYLRAAMATRLHAAGPDEPEGAIVRIFADPVRVEIGAGRHVWRSPGTPTLADMVADVLAQGFEQLPETVRRRTLQAVTAGAEIVLLIDMAASVVGAALLTDHDDNPPLIFVLHRPAQVH